MIEVDLDNPKFGMADSKKGIFEIRVFTEMRGFTFKYPVFKDWWIKRIEPLFAENFEKSIIWLEWPEEILFDDAQRIIVEKYNITNKQDANKLPVYTEKPADLAKKNKSGIYYKEFNSEKDAKDYYIEFYSENYRVRITLITPNEKHGFSRKEFIKEVVRSFKFTQ
ncbi:MAG: hypothetical protein NTY48_05330 [Candidatus Diapherotrites archaeon]|nr:hypothetical protein [Candidatus Diapherotrites archaeon]